MRMCLFAVLLCFTACKEKQQESKTNGDLVILDELDWILGKWQREDTQELEMWSKKETSFYGGIVANINENEKAVIKEVLSLEGRKEGIYYSAKVSGQNNGKKVEFKMSNNNFDSPKFSNEKHDYPQHISYMKIGSDKIKVEISGDGRESQSFYYIRQM